MKTIVERIIKLVDSMNRFSAYPITDIEIIQQEESNKDSIITEKFWVSECSFKNLLTLPLNINDLSVRDEIISGFEARGVRVRVMNDFILLKLL